MRYVLFPIFLVGYFLFTMGVSNAQVVNAIQQVQFDQKQRVLTLFSKSPLTPDLKYVQGQKPQIIVDLPDTVFPTVHQRIIPQTDNIEAIRISQFSSEPPQVRMVWDLEKPMQFLVKTEKWQQGYKTHIQSDLNLEQTPILSAPVQVAQATSKKRLTSLSIQNNNLLLEGSEAIVPEIRKTANSKKYILTLHGFKSDLNKQPDLGSPLIQQVRLLQKSKALEIHFEVTSDTLEVVPFSQENRCVIQLIPTVKKSQAIRIQNVDVYEMAPDVNRIRIFSEGEFDYQLYPLENPNRLVIDTIGTTMPNFNQRIMDSSLLKKVTLSPLYVDSGSDIRLVFELKKDVKYQYHFNPKDNYLEITLQSRKTIPLSNYNALIVIDPGHGGNDPGALGKGGTREKDVALKVSRYLERYLTNDRHKVLLTRSEDAEVLLQPRVDVANLRDADLFVSVHLNSMPPGNTHVHGIETYYTTPQSLDLANTLNQYLVNELGAKNRGVRKRGLYVTRKTKMPSVLLEIGFLSNPTEEGKLSNAEYQRRVAKAIRDGIEDYLSKHPPKKRQRS